RAEAASDPFSWRTGMSTDVTDVLRTTDLLGSAPAADLEAIAAASRSRTFRRGQILFTAGDPGNTLIVVISGRRVRRAQCRRRRPQVGRRRNPGGLPSAVHPARGDQGPVRAGAVGRPGLGGFSCSQPAAAYPRNVRLRI